MRPDHGQAAGLYESLLLMEQIRRLDPAHTVLSRVTYCYPPTRRAEQIGKAGLRATIGLCVRETIRGVGNRHCVMELLYPWYALWM